MSAAIRHEATDEEDPRSAAFKAMQDVVVRLWSPGARWHAGEVAWSRYSVPGGGAGWRTAWWTRDGLAVGWGWVERPGEIALVADPAVPGLLPLVLDWCLAHCAADVPSTCLVLETETDVAAALVERRFEPQPALPWFTYHSMPLERGLPDPVVAPGYRLRHVEAGDAERRAAAHRAGWSEFGSRMPTERYARVMAATPYRPELDWVVEAPDGEWVASALAWLDERNHCGILEPVSCAPEHRRRGLAAAVSLRAVHALRDAGATLALVNPRGDEGYPAPGVLYRALGFRPGPRTVTYVRAVPSSESTLRNR